LASETSGSQVVTVAMGSCSPFGLLGSFVSAALTFIGGLISAILGLFGLTSPNFRRGSGWFG
jgi:hypothetical protein